MKTRVELGEKSYDIILERGLLGRAGDYLNLDRKVLIVTDEGVPEAYAKAIAGQSREPYIRVVKQGEGSKSLTVFGELLSHALACGFTRKDCVVAVGGGVCGDLAGFVAASYMRGIDFYNIPTTLLSQVDSSIGGKTAINLDGIKNIVGAFYQPKCVLIDSDVLKTLPPRQISSGLAEALKMSMTSDRELWQVFRDLKPLTVLKTGKPAGDAFPEEEMELIERIVFSSIEIKRRVVEQDEKESGLRKILNFGHTIGHGVEAEEALHGLYHGECVALGMIPMTDEALRPELIRILTKLCLPTSLSFNKDVAMAAIRHDKKGASDRVSVTLVKEPGSFINTSMTYDEIENMLPVICQ